MTQSAVTERLLSVRLSCESFGVSETCYSYQPKLSDEMPISLTG